MQLEQGKCYKDREGSVYEVVGAPVDSYPFTVVGGFSSWTVGGKAVKGELSMRDLVAEVDPQVEWNEDMVKAVNLLNSMTPDQRKLVIRELTFSVSGCL